MSDFILSISEITFLFSTDSLTLSKILLAVFPPFLILPDFVTSPATSIVS